ncbi:hypothetical protein [Photorhabdus sp. RM71S]|uniref:hypothetical protein n=1 Tax=Photorhabdus sp. RM71S TaxID=3342824 RepID=UPI0036DF1A40
MDTSSFLNLFTMLLNSKGIDVRFNWLEDIGIENIQDYEPSSDSRILILLDQTSGIVDDRYPLSEPLRSKCAVQHINVNPNDFMGDAIESGLLMEFEEKETGKFILYPDFEQKYFNYGISEINGKEYQEMLVRNLEISVKELLLKQLLLCPEVRVSELLPKQVECLNERMAIITDGYFFTVNQDRPVLIPFNPTDPQLVKVCDQWLQKFDTSVVKLLELLEEKWPYSYRPQEVMDRFETEVEKVRRFVKRLTIILSKELANERVSIILQDPKYDTPHMLPKGMTDVLSDMNKQVQQHLVYQWLLPDLEVLIQQIGELTEEGEISQGKAATLNKELPQLVGYWNNELADLMRNNIDKTDYKTIKQAVFSRWLKKQNSVLKGNAQPKKTASTSLISSWDSLLSRVFDKPLKDIKGWLRNVPGIQRLWYDNEQHYFVVGGLSSPKAQLQRQPSIRQWHALQGKLDVALLCALLDVDWVRMNQLAGNPCVATLIKRWKECHLGKEIALLPKGKLESI